MVHFNGDSTPNPIWVHTIARQGQATITAVTTSTQRSDGTQNADVVLSRVALDD